MLAVHEVLRESFGTLADFFLELSTDQVVVDVSADITFDTKQIFYFFHVKEKNELPSAFQSEQGVKMLQTPVI